MEQKNNIEQIRSKMNLAELHISRFPKSSKTFVVDYANEQFEGDYGMCLHHIVMTYRGMTPIGYDELQNQVNELKGELELLKEVLTKPKDKKELKTMKDRIEAMESE